jgi:2-polyprenyl-3-methyl-5-hydroxy-6-metoxy-1,4-benzoquinol methylase
MINWLHSKLHRPERGWDPIPEAYAREYADLQWKYLDETPLGVVEEWIGGFAGKQVLDLGAGPGHFSGAIARRGARVTWYDVSAAYREIARQRTQGLSIEFSIGYLDEVLCLGEGRFDLVFNRICWYYCRSDAAFARIIWRMLRPGGVAYIDSNNGSFQRPSLSLQAALRTYLNSTLGWKIGHPMPPRGRIADLVLKRPVESVWIDYSRPENDRILFRKARPTS